MKTAENTIAPQIDNPNLAPVAGLESPEEHAKNTVEKAMEKNLKPKGQKPSDIGAKNNKTFDVEPDAIVVEEGFNLRNFNSPDMLAHVENLSMSIRTVGLKTPITCRFENGRFVLINGECRLRAVKHAIEKGAKIKTIPVFLEAKANQEDAVFGMLLGNSGKPFDPLEEGEGILRLINWSWKPQGISNRLGISQGRVSQLLSLARLPEMAKTFIRQNQISSTEVVNLIPEFTENKTLDGAGLVKAIETAIDLAKTRKKSKATGQDIDRAMEILHPKKARTEEKPMEEEKPENTSQNTPENAVNQATNSASPINPDAPKITVNAQSQTQPAKTPEPTPAKENSAVVKPTLEKLEKMLQAALEKLALPPAKRTKADHDFAVDMVNDSLVAIGKMLGK